VPSDLTVVNVKLPSPLKSPCPIVILVTIRNDGTDLPDATFFDVTIEFLRGGDSPPVRFQTLITETEKRNLPPGRTLDVPVSVQIPCGSSTNPWVDIRATVDALLQVVNNLRTAPSMVLPQVIPWRVPWLEASMQVFHRDPSFIATVDPRSICPNSDLFADVAIKNVGCADAKPFSVVVTLEDPNTTPPTRLGIQSFSVGSLLAGTTASVNARFTTPATAAAPSGMLAVRAVADSSNDNPDQCDRSKLTAVFVRPFLDGGPPRLTLTVGGAGTVRPGEIPSFDFTIDNDCTDIGVGTVRLTFGTPATSIVVFSKLVQVGLHTIVSGSFPASDIVIPGTIASAFWRVGTKPVTLELSSRTGAMFTGTTMLTVVPEVLDSSWWSWGPAPVGFWNASYRLTGSVVNRSLAPMTITTATALEHPTDVAGTGSDTTATPTAIPAMAAMPGATTAAVIWTQRETWPWIAAVSWLEVGPRLRVFSYVATFTVTDSFGNVSMPVTSVPILATIAVSGTKITKHDVGIGLIVVGSTHVIVGVSIIIWGGPYAWVGVIIAAAGMAMVIAGTLLEYEALDPPVPDFRERDPGSPNPRAWRIAEPQGDEAHALHTLAVLLGRLVTSVQNAKHARGRAWAAFVDRDESMRVRHRDAMHDELETVRRLVDACVDAADEAHGEWEKFLRELRAAPTLEEVRAALPRVGSELGLTEKELAIVDQAFEQMTDAQAKDRFEKGRKGGLRSIADLVQRLRDSLFEEGDARGFLG
jgi:hypothetical protein